MLTIKERTERAASIRAHILKYSKTGSLDELAAAYNEMVILRRLEGLPVKQPLGDDLGKGVIPDLTDAEAAGFVETFTRSDDTCRWCNQGAHCCKRYG